MKNKNSSEDKGNKKELITETNVNVKGDENKESSSDCLEYFEELYPSYELGYN
jgi:hypothetical protein